jgi:V/A-type H+-transporting ATPase subunit F
MKFLVIGDKDTVTGFSLTGIEGLVVNSKTETVKALQKVIHRQDIGVILITERLAREIQKTIDSLLSYRKKCHLILQIPDVHRSMPVKHTVEEFVLSALGIKV